jgi:hypothetical protein
VEVDITTPSNKPWFAKYKYDIPVLHLNGYYFAKHRISLETLEAGLEQASKGDIVLKDGDPNPQLPSPPTPLQ